MYSRLCCDGVYLKKPTRARSGHPLPFNTNLLLAKLSPGAITRLPFEQIELKSGEVLCRAHTEVAAAYFPLSGMISLVQTLDDGATVEVGILGREGFFGLPLLHGNLITPIEALVQGNGMALRLPADHFAAELRRNTGWRSWLSRYAGTLYAQAVQIAACNTRHTVEERLARRLLEAHDRADTDEMPMRHEFMAYMLGCRRAGVTTALGALRRSSVIGVGRGTIIVRDRGGLEAASCVCYETIGREFRRLYAVAESASEQTAQRVRR